MALQAKSFSSIITAEPLTLHRGPTEEDKQRRGVKQRRERQKREIDFQSERLPRCSGGLWLQCCTLHLFTAERHTSMWGKRRVGVWCTSSSLEMWLQPHYVLFQSPSAYWNTLSACLQTYLFYFHTLHFIWVLIIWIIEQKKRSSKKWARDEIKTHLSVFAEDELYSAATRNNWADGRTAGKQAEPNSSVKMKFGSSSRTLTCSGNANRWY